MRGSEKTSAPIKEEIVGQVVHGPLVTEKKISTICIKQNKKPNPIKQQKPPNRNRINPTKH